MCATHTHGILINIDTWYVHVAIFELMKHIVVHHFGIHAWFSVFASFWSDTICKTCEFKIRIKTKMIVTTDCNGKIDWSFPFVGRKHLHDHHFGTSESFRFLEHNLLTIWRKYIESITRKITFAITFGAWIGRMQELECLFYFQWRIEMIFYPNYFILAWHIILFVP